jgi:hypothetical protein
VGARAHYGARLLTVSGEKARGGRGGGGRFSLTASIVGAVKDGEDRVATRLRFLMAQMDGRWLGVVECSDVARNNSGAGRSRGRRLHVGVG